VAEKRLKQTRLGQAEVDFYTIGYERLKIEDLFARLRDADVHCLVDVRDTPWSRVPDYRRDVLDDKLAGLSAANEYQIRYVSIPALGNPVGIRNSDRPTPEMMAAYRQHALSRSRELEELQGIIKSCRTALMCYEANPAECHRSTLAAIITEKYGLTYEDLRY
jgi:Uncharacterized conserved protein